MVHVDKTIIDKEMSDFLTDNNERLTKLKEECAKYMKSAADETNGKVSPEHLVNIKPKFHMFTLFPKERYKKKITIIYFQIYLHFFDLFQFGLV